MAVGWSAKSGRGPQRGEDERRAECALIPISASFGTGPKHPAVVLRR